MMFDAYSVQDLLMAVGLVVVFGLGFIGGQQR